MNLFKKRVEFKPFEYPEIIKFIESINHSYWLHTEFNYSADINDYHTKISQVEKNAIKNTILAISQIEVSVKAFWGDIYNRFPKPEFNAVGATFAESEVRHSRAYAHLLEILGINDEFKSVVNQPAIKGRIDYISKYLRNSKVSEDKEYTLILTLFSLFIENVSLFSQFLIIKAFNKERNLFKGIDNVIQATQKEETIHALFGAYLIKLIKSEQPTWFDEQFYIDVKKACKKAYIAELKIIDWIFEKGELTFLSKLTIIEFIKDRFNQSLQLIDCDKLFEVDSQILQSTEWFNVENLAETHTDFFHKTSTNYNKKSNSFTAEDLF